MHTIGDLFVPFSMEQVYARRAQTNGNDDLLVQRAIRDVGHSAFSPVEWDQAITDLTAWVHGGAAASRRATTCSRRRSSPTPLTGADSRG